MNHDLDPPEEESQAFLPQSKESEYGAKPAHEKRSGQKYMGRYLRLLFEICMASTIVILLIFRSPSSDKPLRRSPVPQRTSSSSRVTFSGILIFDAVKCLERYTHFITMRSMHAKICSSTNPPRFTHCITGSHLALVFFLPNKHSCLYKRLTSNQRVEATLSSLMHLPTTFQNPTP